MDGNKHQTGVMVVGMGMQSKDLHQVVAKGRHNEEEKTDVLVAT